MDRDKAALKYVEEIRDKLSKTQPLPVMLYKMLEPNPSKRITCEEALRMEVFKKFMYPTIEKTIQKRIRPLPEEELDDSDKSRKKSKKKDYPTEEDIAQRYYEALEFTNPLTKQAALVYHSMASEPMEHCMVIAGKMFEEELLDMSSVEDFIEDFDPDAYIDSEINIFRAMDFCLYID